MTQQFEADLDADQMVTLLCHLPSGDPLRDKIRDYFMRDEDTAPKYEEPALSYRLLALNTAMETHGTAAAAILDALRVNGYHLVRRVA